MENEEKLLYKKFISLASKGFISFRDLKDDVELYAIVETPKSSFMFVLSKSENEFIYEERPSERDESKLSDIRFTFEEILTMIKNNQFEVRANQLYLR
jgi:hypothetical protein